jgi:hypothetical protein
MGFDHRKQLLGCIENQSKKHILTIMGIALTSYDEHGSLKVRTTILMGGMSNWTEMHLTSGFLRTMGMVCTIPGR